MFLYMNPTLRNSIDACRMPTSWRGPKLTKILCWRLLPPYPIGINNITTVRMDVSGILMMCPIHSFWWCVQSIHSDDVSNPFSLMMCPIHSFWWCVQAIHSEDVSNPFILRMCPIHSFWWCVQSTHSDDVSNPFILMMCPIHSFWWCQC